MSDAERTIKLDLKEITRIRAARRPVLVVLQGQSMGLTVQLAEGRTIIGRGSTGDVVLRDDVASRQHAAIDQMVSQDGCVEYYIKDLGSTNGTYLNGTSITSEQLLQDGDKVKIGEHLLKFAMLDEFEAEFQERLHQMIQRDELTGLRSRRSLFAELDREISRAVAACDNQPIVAIMMDLDFFKRVNDGRGHLIGSQTIRDVGKIIAETLGSTDMAARYGGEEYLAYVRGPIEKGLEAAEKIRTAVETHAFQASTSDLSQTMQVTISMGLASFPVDGKTALEIVQKADYALYRAKQEGRNRCSAFNPELDKPNPLHSGPEAGAIFGPADAQ